MSYFDWVEAHGGLDPYAEQPEEERRICCYCALQLDEYETAVIVNRQSSNVQIAHVECVEECGKCSQPQRKGTLIAINRNLAVCGSCAREIVDYVQGCDRELKNDERKS